MGTPTSFRRPARASLAVALVLVGTVAAGSHAAAVRNCGAGATTNDAGNGWAEIHPRFPAGDPTVTAVAAPAFDPNLVYATNGTVLMRTRDAGCTWTSVFTAAASGVAASLANTQITALYAPSSANTSATVYVGVTSTVAGVDQPSIAVSTDRGTTWSPPADIGQSGLPATGRVDDLAAEAAVPQVAYALIGLTEAGVHRESIYATSDAGTTWSDRTGTTASTPTTIIAAHPLQSTTLYGLGQNRLVTSGDGGASFTPIASLPSAVTTYGLASGAGTVRIAAVDSDQPLVHMSANGGTTWTSLVSPVLAQSVAVAPLQNLVTVSDAQYLYFLGPGFSAQYAGPGGPAPIDLSVSAPTAAGFTVTGLRAGAILQATYGLNRRPVPLKFVNGVLRPIQLIPPGIVRQFPSTLTPSTTTITLAAGTSTVVPYRLLVPRTPTPVDVMFLIDTTSSMQPVIDGLRQGIAQIAITLDTTGLDAQFGVGDFRDYPSPYGTAQGGDWPYRIDGKVTVAGPALQAALGTLQATGGTFDGGESALTALYQSTVGDGDLEDDQTYVPPEEDAGYRAKSLKLVMLATDTEPHYGGEQVRNGNGQTITNPGPGYDDVITALRSHHVHQMGLWVDPGSGPTARPAMTKFAAATDTIAPAGGVDCNGDGRVDVAAKNPLVCTIGSETGAPVGVGGVGGSTNVAPGALTAAVVGLATEIPDYQPVSLAVTRGRAYAAAVGRAATTVNMHADNELSYGLSLHCPASASGAHPISVAAHTPVRVLAAASVTLSCVNAPVTGPLAAAPPVLRAIALAPAAPPPAPNPLPNPNVNVNQAPSFNVNGALAQQREEQAQLAYAQDEGWAPDGTQLAMSRYRGSGDADAVFLAGAASLAAVAGGVAYGRRRQHQLSYLRQMSS